MTTTSGRLVAVSSDSSRWQLTRKLQKKAVACCGCCTLVAMQLQVTTSNFTSLTWQ